MSEAKPKKNKAISHWIGDGISVFGGAWVANYLQLPFGLPASSFTYGCAPIAALAGYEIATRSRGWFQRHRSVAAGLLGLVVVPMSFFLYYYLLSSADPGIISIALIYLSFSATFFCLFFAFGLLKVRIFGDR